MALLPALLFPALLPGLELTDNLWDDVTEGKSVFLMFANPRCGERCDKHKETFATLSTEFADDSERLVATVDCDGSGKASCNVYGVSSIPAFRFGDPENLHTYDNHKWRRGLRLGLPELKSFVASMPTLAEFRSLKPQSALGARLSDAAASGDLQTVKALLGSDVSGIASSLDVNAVDEFGRTALMHASIKGHADVIKELITAGARTDIRCTSYRQSALHYAAPCSHKHTSRCRRVARALIDAGADVNQIDLEGNTALMLSSMNGAISLVKMLLKAGADIHVVNRSPTASVDTNALQLASANGHKEVVRALLKEGADVDLVDWHSGFTPLMQASRNGWFEVVSELLEGDANITITYNLPASVIDTEFLELSSNLQGKTARGMAMNTTSCSQVLNMICVNTKWNKEINHKKVVDLLKQAAGGFWSFLWGGNAGKKKAKRIELVGVEPGGLVEIVQDELPPVQAGVVTADGLVVFDTGGSSEEERLSNLLRPLGEKLHQKYSSMFAAMELTFEEVVVMDEQSLEKLGMPKKTRTKLLGLVVAAKTKAKAKAKGTEKKTNADGADL